MKKKTIKAIKYKGLLIKNKNHTGLWSTEVFSTEEKALSYFKKMCTQNNWDFDWADYELVNCIISFSLPAKSNKK